MSHQSKLIATDIDAYLAQHESGLSLLACMQDGALMQQEMLADRFDMLLELSRHDPKHREVMKHTSKSSSWLFYEPVRTFV